ncbi:MAG: TetR/AcrR family transcriptional regulator [Acidimicrobiales bacterium]
MNQAARRVPRTGRGERTRDVLLDAAQEVFWKKGYLDARVADIAALAGVSHGSFYTYFDSKEAVLRALAADLHEGTVQTGRGTRAAAGGDEVRAIELANRRYLEFYVANRKAMRLMEEVATYNPDMRKARLRTRMQFVERTARSLRRMQHAGTCDPGLDVGTAAHALVGMVSSFAYHMVSTRTPFDVDTAVATLTTLWARGIGLDVPWGGAR